MKVGNKGHPAVLLAKMQKSNLLSRRCIGTKIWRRNAGKQFPSVSDDYTWVWCTGQMDRAEFIQKIAKYCQSQKYKMEFMTNAQWQRECLRSVLFMQSSENSVYSLWRVGRSTPLMKAMIIEVLGVWISGIIGPCNKGSKRHGFIHSFHEYFCRFHFAATFYFYLLSQPAWRKAI